MVDTLIHLDDWKARSVGKAILANRHVLNCFSPGNNLFDGLSTHKAYTFGRLLCRFALQVPKLDGHKSELAGNRAGASFIF